MTTQIDTAIAEQNPSRWQKLLAWITALEKAADYDPHAHTDTRIRQLGETVARLETKVIDLESRDERNIVAIAIDAVDGR